MLRRPQIEEDIAWPGVEADHLFVQAVEDADIAHAADVGDHAHAPLHAEHGTVKRRHQRRAMPAGSQVAAAEVGNDVNAAALGQQGRIIGLARIALQRIVAYGLPVAANGLDLARCHTRPQQQLDDAIGIHIDQQICRQCLAPDFVAARALQRQQFGAQVGCEGAVAGLQQTRLAVGKFGQHAVYAIKAGAGHQADKQLRAHLGPVYVRMVALSAKCASASIPPSFHISTPPSQARHLFAARQQAVTGIGNHSFIASQVYPAKRPSVEMLRAADTLTLYGVSTTTCRQPGGRGRSAFPLPRPWLCYRRHGYRPEATSSSTRDSQPCLVRSCRAPHRA